jgi:hypothetical protein
VRVPLVSLMLAAALAASSAAPAQDLPLAGQSPPSPAGVQQGGGAPFAAERAAPTRKQVQQAVEQLAQDPNLAGKRRQKTLRFKASPEKASPQPAPTLQWLADLFRWVADAGRLLVWALGAVALALLLVGLRHWVRWRGGAGSAPAAKLPSHVRDLDIRRESLPADIGTAARALWERGQARSALSLLYRGALSRLVHLHAVPIRASSTEEECVRLAARALDRPDSDFLARLVQAWELTVYGSRLPDGAEVLALCAGFDARLGRQNAPQAHPPALAGAQR